jgi:hypothetical protein
MAEDVWSPQGPARLGNDLCCRIKCFSLPDLCVFTSL